MKNWIDKKIKRTEKEIENKMRQKRKEEEEEDRREKKNQQIYTITPQI